MKKYTLSLCVLALVGSVNITYATFPDVSSSHPHFDAINYAKTQAIVSGNPDGTYRPDETISRAAFTKILINARYNSNEIDSCDKAFYSFPDVDANQWYAPYICMAKQKGLVSGYPDGTFRPGNNLNLAELSKIVSSSFGDPVKTTTPWYRGYIDYLAEANAIPTQLKGFDAKVTRGQMAEIVARLLQKNKAKASHSYASLSGESVNPNPTQEVIESIDEAVETILEEEDLFQDFGLEDFEDENLFGDLEDLLGE